MPEQRLIDANPIVKFIQDGLNSKDTNKQFGNDAVQILAEIEFAPTVDAWIYPKPYNPDTAKEDAE